jgi:hypothetical protein
MHPPMKSQTIIIFFLFLIFQSCSNSKKENKLVSKDSSGKLQLSINKGYKTAIIWVDRNNLILQVDTTLSHKGSAFSCDSAIAFDYIGFEGEHTFSVLNDKGQWINTIKQSKKLSANQILRVHNILGNKESFDNPMFVGCYEPRLGIVYFKQGKVIGQDKLCLGCARLESTARLGNGENYSSFNKKTMRQLEKLCQQLNFSDCSHWKD